MAQWVRDSALSCDSSGYQPWCEFEPWPRNFCMLKPGKKKKKKLLAYKEKSIEGVMS